MGVQAFVAESPVKAFDEGVVGRFARPGKVQGHPVLVGPAIKRLGDELGTVVDADGPGRAAARGDPLHGLDDLFTSNALIDIDGQGPAGESIDYGQRPQAPAVEQRVRYKVHRPKLVRRSRPWVSPAPGGGDVSARSPEPKTEAILPIEPLDALVVHPPPLAAQQNVESEIAVPRPGPREVPDAHDQRRLIGLDRLIAHRRPVERQGGADAPLADPMGRLHIPHDLAPPTGPQTFFDSTS